MNYAEPWQLPQRRVIPITDDNDLDLRVRDRIIARNNSTFAAIHRIAMELQDATNDNFLGSYRNFATNKRLDDILEDLFGMLAP